ncbi:hypothetical protein DQ04_01941060 [Trypanosoma grayi]|uniref:hypothetical protein n=1 Tax=Trypanosoma grayi TaxID=71804 RepID=UPI0004F48905|nr:hypothetical protein DQ04_01941060 [Trypanosoma grayi]KEG12159.1 hypothetical protein DQ04_01941060 [Trypanosoma grayi]
MDTEEGEFIVCGSCGTAKDIQFDELVGVIEGFMVNFDPSAVLKRLPPISSVTDDHERHVLHKGVLAQVEAELDAYVLENCPSIESMEDAASLLLARSGEIADEVWDFISEGCFDYSAFVEMWGNSEK